MGSVHRCSGVPPDATESFGLSPDLLGDAAGLAELVQQEVPLVHQALQLLPGLLLALLKLLERGCGRPELHLTDRQ